MKLSFSCGIPLVFKCCLFLEEEIYNKNPFPRDTTTSERFPTLAGRLCGSLERQMQFLNVPPDDGNLIWREREVPVFAVVQAQNCLIGIHGFVDEIRYETSEWSKLFVYEYKTKDNTFFNERYMGMKHKYEDEEQLRIYKRLLEYGPSQLLPFAELMAIDLDTPIKTEVWKTILGMFPSASALPPNTSK